MLPPCRRPDHEPIRNASILINPGAPWVYAWAGQPARLHGLHPSDPYEAARHEALLAYVEEMRAHVSPTLRMKNEVEKKAARESLASDYLPTWGRFVERQLGAGPFFAGAAIHVVDLKLYMGVRWFKSGVLDHVPTTVFDAFPKLTRLYEAVGSHARIRAWVEKK